MDDQRLGRLVRALRQRRGWRQVDVAQRAGTSQSVISELELGRVSGMTVGTVRRIGAALGASTELRLHGLGAEPDRLLDGCHARLVGTTLELLGRFGWTVQPEVSYSEWGERGSIDLPGWFAPTRSLLVVEVKTELASLEEALRKHDEKARLGRRVAADRLGWRVATIGRLLVLPATRTTRRRIADHAGVLGAAYPTRNRHVLAWLARPTGDMAGLALMSDIAPGRGTPPQGVRSRVRARRPPPS